MLYIMPHYGVVSRRAIVLSGQSDKILYMSSYMNQLQLGQWSVVGFSLAGEETVITVPELNVAFDVGRAPREVLTVDNVLLSHGHMDHAAGLGYYFSQRNFQGNMGGTVVAPHQLVDPIKGLMNAWTHIEGHRTPFRVVGLGHGEDYEIRRNLYARGFTVNHPGPCLGYSIVEVRNKLQDKYLGLPGAEIAQLRRDGVDVTHRVEIPLVAYCGDTADGDFFDLDHVRHARVLLLECTFFEPDHAHRAKLGCHLHVNDLPAILERLHNEHILLTHLSRRTALRYARGVLRRTIRSDDLDRIDFLMDGRFRPRNEHVPRNGRRREVRVEGENAGAES